MTVDYRGEVRSLLASLSKAEPDVHASVRAARAAGARFRLVVDFLDDGETLVRVRVIHPNARNWWATARRYVEPQRPTAEPPRQGA